MIRPTGNGSFQFDLGRAQFSVRESHLPGAATVQCGPGIIEIPVASVREIGAAMIRYADFRQLADADAEIRKLQELADALAGSK